MSLKEAILDAAEHVFATHGYDGTSMRLIARRAEVAQALLHYHFKNKEKLYAALFERRSSAINASRERFLDSLLKKTKTPTLEDVLEIMLMPPARIGENQRGDYEMFQQIVSALSVSTDQRSKALMVRYYDPIAHRFIEEFQKIVPGLSEQQAVWCYLFALGARQQAQTKTKREARLLRGKGVKKTTSPEMLLLPFIAAGIRAIAAGAKPKAVRRPARR
jgi:AcrR family transcriptional regulator